MTRLSSSRSMLLLLLFQWSLSVWCCVNSSPIYTQYHQYHHPTLLHHLAPGSFSSSSSSGSGNVENGHRPAFIQSTSPLLTVSNKNDNQPFMSFLPQISVAALSPVGTGVQSIEDELMALSPDSDAYNDQRQGRI